MHLVSSLVLAVVLVLASSARAAEPSAPFDAKVARRISVDAVQKRLAAKEKVVFLDSRPAGGDTMIAGAAHVSDGQLATWTKDLPKNTLIVTYCA